METLFPPSSLVERFLFPPSDLPVLGSSALESILEEESSSSSSSSSSSEEMENRMSPDSTEDHSGLNTMDPSSNSSSSHLQALPDSTTSSLPDYDSDAFDSDDSRSSLAELNYIHPSFPPESPLLLPQSHPALLPSTPVVEEPRIHHPENNLPAAPSIKQKKKKKTKRAGETVLHCDLCDYSTRYKEHLTSHMNTHVSERNFMCSDCGQTFKWGHSLKRHQRTHQADHYKKFACRFCHKSFSRKDHLSIHEGLHSESSSSYPCRICGASFKNKKTLTGHEKTHNGEKGFKCQECDSEFTRRASLNRHVRASHSGVLILCPLCPATFSYRSTLEDHKKAVHNEGKREFGCELCGVQFAVKAYLTKHWVTCKNRAEGKSFSCDSCSKSFPTKRHLTEHLKRKLKKDDDPPQANNSNTTQIHPTVQTPTPNNNSNATLIQPMNPGLYFDPLHTNYGHYNSGYEIPKEPNNTAHHHPHHQQIHHSQDPGMNILHQQPQQPYSLPSHSDDENVGSLLRSVYNTVESHQGYAYSSTDVVMDYHSVPSGTTSTQHHLLEGLPLDCI
uniref:Zinc finger protein 729like [Anolis carolinensis] n=1 Tax=Lepeophtheirus salmonis TaxID=72036 RepID=A0A0K2UFN6_LEPSM